MRLMRFLIVFVGSFLSVESCDALAQTFTNSVGNFTCQTWLSDKGSPAALRDDGWIEGFITYNELSESGRLRQNLTLGEGVQEIFSWFDEYCRSNPTSTISDATNVFLDMHSYRQINY